MFTTSFICQFTAISERSVGQVRTSRFDPFAVFESGRPQYRAAFPTLFTEATQFIAHTLAEPQNH